MKDYKFKILFFVGVIFFFVYSFLIFGNTLNKFTWPDETANYFFISSFVNNSSVSFFEPLNEVAGNLIKGRSFNVFNNNLVPGSFLGMILIYGLIGKVVGIGLIKFLTPFLAVVAGWFFYGILLKVFKPNIAFLSALLFFINPAWWYYANLSMLPNIAFLSFLIIGIYFLLQVKQNKTGLGWVMLAGFFIGLSLIIRTNEFLWIIGILLLLLLAYIREVKWHQPAFFILMLVLVFLPVFYFNQQTYGDYLSFGYLRLDQGGQLLDQIPREFVPSQKSALYNFVKFLVLPFGLNYDNFSTNFYNYYISLFPWLFVSAFWGVICLLRKVNKAKAVYLVAFLAVSVYLVFYYGSWQFVDKFTLDLNRLGISYVRYWLPVYILSLPLAVLFYDWLISLLKNKKARLLLSALIIFTWLIMGVNLLYLSGNDNLIQLKTAINSYQQISQKVFALTEENAVIISQRSDKIFIPERKVIGKWEEAEIKYWVDLVGQGVPVYYYAFEGDDYLADFNFKLQQEYGLGLVEEKKITDKERLFRIYNFYYE